MLALRQFIAFILQVFVNLESRVMLNIEFLPVVATDQTSCGVQENIRDRTFRSLYVFLC